jgi:adenylate kinase family enzyme
VYDDLTEPLISYYRGLELLETVSADRPVAEVFVAMVVALDKLPRP